MPPVTKTSISLDPAIDKELKARHTERSAAIDSALSRYYFALADARRSLAAMLSTNEISLIVDVLNSTLFEPWSARYLSNEILDSIPDGTGEKWSVDVPALATKIAALSYIEKLTIIDAAERYWHSVSLDQPPQFSDILK